MNSDLNYPNLTACRLTLTNTAASANPPVRLPRDCVQASNIRSPSTPYEFALEREVLKRKDVIEKEQKLAKITDPVELHNKSVAYMKEITGADEDTCILKLESNGYNLKESLAAVRR